MQHRARRPVALAGLTLWALLAACLRVALPFVAAARAPRSPGAARAEGLAPAPPRAGGLQRLSAPASSAGPGLAGALACAASAALALQLGAWWRPARAAGQRGRRSPGRSGRRAEPEDESPYSLVSADLGEDEEARQTELQMEGDWEGQTKFSEDDLDDSVEVKEMSAEEAARRGARQVVYNLYPSNQYVLYIAKKNAERTWAKDSFLGPKADVGCIEVQIAILTERIRNMVLHVREFKHDFKCRLKLIQVVARRRRLLDKLSWKNLDAYIKIREELKIRHIYRMEALIGRLPAYKYTMRDRKQAPGRKVAMRLKKTNRLLARRLATQLRQGKPKMIIHKTKTKIESRRWMSRPYDEANSLIAGKPLTTYIDPLNIP